MIHLSTILNHIHLYLKENIAESCKQDFEVVQAFLFMSITKKENMNIVLYEKCIKEYKINKDFKNSVDRCLKNLKTTYKDEKFPLTDGTVVEGNTYFDKVFYKINLYCTKINEENIL